jgi:hypothetical protein
MEIEVRQRGGVLGLDRRFLVKDGMIEVTDRGRSQAARPLAPDQAARIVDLADSAYGAEINRGDELVSDDLETTVAIVRDGDSSSLQLHSGDEAPPEVWDLIGEVSRATQA